MDCVHVKELKNPIEVALLYIEIKFEKISRFLTTVFLPSTVTEPNIKYQSNSGPNVGFYTWNLCRKKTWKSHGSVPNTFLFTSSAIFSNRSKTIRSLFVDILYKQPYRPTLGLEHHSKSLEHQTLNSTSFWQF